MKYSILTFLLFFLSCAGKPGGGGGGDTGPACGSCAPVTPEHAVVLVHGRNDTKNRWDALVADWATKGYTEGTNLFRWDATADCGDNGYCSVLPSYPATTVNESYALCLKAFIDANVPTGQVDLVTHSQGGVTARYYSRFLDTAKVAAMVNMSGPLQGTNNCALAGACTGINPETCPDSPVMRKLNGVAPEGDGTNDESYGTVSYSVVVSDKDSVIQPWCSGEYISDPQTYQADDMNCRSPNYTVDTSVSSCAVSSQHLTIPLDATAMSFAYCAIN